MRMGRGFAAYCAPFWALGIMLLPVLTIARPPVCLPLALLARGRLALRRRGRRLLRSLGCRRGRRLALGGGPLWPAAGPRRRRSSSGAAGHGWLVRRAALGRQSLQVSATGKATMVEGDSGPAPSRPWRGGAGPGAAPGPGDPLGGALRLAAAPPVARAGQGRVTDRVPIGWIDFMRRIRSSTASQQSFVCGDAGSPSGLWRTGQRTVPGKALHLQGEVYLSNCTPPAQERASREPSFFSRGTVSAPGPRQGANPRTRPPTPAPPPAPASPSYAVKP